ncbi:hypothetical protein [Neobacillus sp. LXY-4]|uniref:hypothetical protein n=1 Tax=Neobacillus sp. LXY-4 TaxID=3379826 RepID=UPI003EE10093
MEKILNQRIKKQIEECHKSMLKASNDQAKTIYMEILERYMLINDILEDPECEMNEGLYYGILSLIAVNRARREDVFNIDKENSI